MALGIIAWAFVTGFAENSRGELTFSSGDVLRLVMFATAAVVLSHSLRRSDSYGSEETHG